MEINAHTEVTNPLTYNDEHCFQSAICLAYFYANPATRW